MSAARETGATNTEMQTKMKIVLAMISIMFILRGTAKMARGRNDGDSNDDVLVTIEYYTREQGRKGQAWQLKAERSDGVVLVMRAGMHICICMCSARDHNE